LEMLTLANEAGLEIDKADALIAKIREGKEKVALADQVLRLRKEWADATAYAEKICERNNKEITRLEKENQLAGYKHDDAFRAMCEAHQAANDLLLLHDDGLLPTPHKEVNRLLDGRAAEQKKRALENAWRDAEEERNRCRLIVYRIEQDLENLPMSISYRQDQGYLGDELAKAKANLADAEAKVEKAKKAIPA